MKIFKFCKIYILDSIYLFVLYIVINVFMSIINIFIPYSTGVFLDLLISGGDLKKVYKFCFLFITLSITKMLVGYISSTIYVKLQINMGYNLNKTVIELVQSKPISFFEKIDKSYLSQIINVDSNSLIIFCLNTIQNTIISIFTLIFSVIIMFRLNKFIMLILIFLILIYYIVYFILKKYLYKINFEMKEAQGNFFAKLFEQFNFIKLIKTQSIQKEMNNRLDNEFKNILKYSLKSQKANYLFSSLDGLLMLFSQAVLYFYGATLIFKKQLTVGYFTMFLNYFSMMFSSVRYFFNLGKEYQDICVSYDRLQNYFEVQENNIKKANKRIKKINSIKLQNVSFSFLDNQILKNISLEFNKGNIYIIKGKNGSGKSTLVNLILGLYSNNFEGEILINNISIKDLDMNYLRKKFIGVSEQEPEMINDTLKYNLFFDEEVNNKFFYYEEYLGFNYFVDNLPNGLDTFIYDKGSNISGGEKQKISILRALVKNPDVLIFDEPTSALDFETKEKFYSLLKELKKNKIIILITHDEFIINLSEQVYNLE